MNWGVGNYPFFNSQITVLVFWINLIERKVLPSSKRPYQMFSGAIAMTSFYPKERHVAFVTTVSAWPIGYRWNKNWKSAFPPRATPVTTMFQVTADQLCRWGFIQLLPACDSFLGTQHTKLGRHRDTSHCSLMPLSQRFTLKSANIYWEVSQSTNTTFLLCGI